MAVTLTPRHLMVMVDLIREKDPDARAIGIRSDGSWDGEDRLEVDGTSYQVVIARSVLEVREALEICEEPGHRVVIITPLTQDKLGRDVVARLARSRLLSVNVWEVVRDLFRASQLDPAMPDKCVAEALIEYAPPDGYPPVMAGILDATTVWRALFRTVLAMDDRELDLAGLLRWTASASGPERYQSISDGLRVAVRERLTTHLGPAAKTVLSLVESGHAEDALGLAVVCQVVFARGQESSELQSAAARLERFHGDRPVDPRVGRQLARAAAQVIDGLEGEGLLNEAERHLRRADELLEQVRVEGYAHLSDLSPMGLEQRMARIGQALSGASESPVEESIAECERLSISARAHHFGARASTRLGRCRMAVRLLRWLGNEVSREGSFGDLAGVYLREMAYADWARDAISSGDECEELSEAFRKVDELAGARRSGWSDQFAEQLREWAAGGTEPSGGLLIEDVLSRVVAPTVTLATRALLVVLDGMSWPVCHELVDDIRKCGWEAASLAEFGEGKALPPVAAAVPCVTQLSRTSLLRGELGWGDQTAERNGFREHEALAGLCQKKYPPLLFHKDELTTESRGGLSEEVRKKILSADHKLVGVVVNAIDDRLSSAPQVRESWTVDAIRPLGQLLRTAKEAGRVVILASDHGHTWHREGEYASHPASGERWRAVKSVGVWEKGSVGEGERGSVGVWECGSVGERGRSEAPGPPDSRALGSRPPSDLAEGEVLVEGPRVRGPEDERKLILAVREGVRYSKPRNGYHGGGSPQEMIAPLVLLVERGQSIKGIVPCDYEPPAWWTAETELAPETRAKPIPRPKSVDREMPLFAEVHPEEKPEEVAATKPAEGKVTARPVEERPWWLEALFESELYQDQKKLLRRRAPDDDLVSECVVALSGRVMTPVAFAQEINTARARVDGLIATLQRVLNVDGYEVLSFDRERNAIELSEEMLVNQFGLK